MVQGRSSGRLVPPKQSGIISALHKGIGLRNERSLHASIKKWYSQPGDELEVKVDGYIVDIVRGDWLIEVQTRNFSAIRHKLSTLVKNHRLRLIYPIAKEKWIVRTNVSGKQILGRRKSPRHGTIRDLFEELVAIPELVKQEHFELEVLLIQEEEVRCADGKGSWWRRGHSLRDRKLIEVVGTVLFRTRHDFLRFLPHDLPEPFSNKSLAETLGMPIHSVRRMTYCLKKMGLIAQTGKSGREFLFEMVE